MKWFGFVVVIMGVIILSACTSGHACEPGSIWNGTGCCVQAVDGSCTITTSASDASSYDVNEVVNNNTKSIQIANETQDDRVEYGELLSTISLLELEANLNTLFRQSFSYHQEEGFGSRIFADAGKSVVIEPVESSLGSYQDFLGVIGAPHYSLEPIYVNQSQLLRLHEELLEGDTYYYTQYLKSRVLVMRREKEVSFDVDHGRVLEDQLQYIKTDAQGNYDGLYVPSIVVYKVYCSPHMIILLKPKWIESERSVGGSVEDATHNFEEEVSHLRKDMLFKADKILQFCPVTYSFFEEMQDVDVENRSFSVFDERIYNERMANITLSAAVDVDKLKIRDSAILSRVHFSMANNDAFTLHGQLNIDVVAQADGQREKRIVSGRKLVASGLSTGEKIEREFEPEFDVEFQDTLKLRFLVYGDKKTDYIRPVDVIFSSSGDVISVTPVTY